ncbi:MAG: hypothetical protein L0226_10720 [Acidobacteria bacterium]|nr:hypothetical protein [Acidobacteriota bacterium]MCI0659733.1 hypothetical protein [Acidobacteriota bacterium]
MAETLTFSKVYLYDTRAPGISVEAVLKSGDKVILCDPKIDTGADNCIFERGHGEALGLDIESGTPQRFGTAVGSFLAYGHVITLSVLGIEITTTVYFAADESFSRNVLGRQGWLDHMRLGLVDYDGKLYLSAYNDTE